jgi:hypothetical protein
LVANVGNTSLTCYTIRFQRALFVNLPSHHIMSSSRLAKLHRIPALTVIAAFVLTASVSLQAGCAVTVNHGAADAAPVASGEKKSTDTPAADKAGADKPAGDKSATDKTAGNGAAKPGAAAATPAAGAPKPFAEIIKDAKEIPGLFTLWQKDEKVWIEIKPEQFDKPFFLAINMSRGLGERMLFAGLMGMNGYSSGGSYMAEMHKIGNNLQLVARNTQFIATEGSPEARAVKKAFSDSLLSSAPVVSLPHPDRKSVLVEANALLLADIPRGNHVLERAYRNQFAFDKANSYIKEAKAGTEATTIDIQAHYSQARIPLPAVQPAGAPPAPFFPAPEVIEDPRSLFLGYLYTFTSLPETPMKPRLADSRIGHFVETKVDFSTEGKFSPRKFYVNRWRLEKKDVSADLSEPVKPITYWLDREIPMQFRAPITAGILEWNKAFEKIGFKDAIVVKQQADDADFDTGDTLHASIRWFTTATPSFGAIGPSQIDPRSGEILDADIGWDANQTRIVRSFRTEAYSVPRAMYDAQTGQVMEDAAGLNFHDGRLCSYFEHAANEAAFGLALMEARGEIEPDSPAADQFVYDFLKDVTMHEVGHTLGLRHNFRASTAHTLEQVADPAFVAEHGVTGSVMEYTPMNLALKSEMRKSDKPRTVFTPTLGEYDYWAIEYAYKPIAPEQEAAELARIAARSNEPQLAFATDQSIGESLDPEVNQGDIGTDPLAYFRRRAELSRELWDLLEHRTLKADEGYEVLRRRFTTGFAQIGVTSALTAKYIGGTFTSQDHAGSPRVPLTPVPAAKQREALALITDRLFLSTSFKVSSEFARKLTLDRLESESFSDNGPRLSTDLQLPDLVIGVQRDVLNRLMSPLVAQRLLNNGTRVASAKDALSIAELYEKLQSAIWSEAKAGTDADLLRRNLQREHLRKVTAALTGPSNALPADARALLRLNARALRDQLAAVQHRASLSPESRAHYAEAHETLNEVLKAQVTKAGV